MPEVWSSCDERCSHFGPFRHQLSDGTWIDHETYRDQEGAITPYLFAHNTIPVEARWRILTVHHLDGVKANCRWWNLAALCATAALTVAAGWLASHRVLGQKPLEVLREE